MTVLVTGAAGFVGAAVCGRLLARGDVVVGLDSFDAYYEVGLKRARVAGLASHPRFRLVTADVTQPAPLAAAFRGVDRVIHLAARPGVRHPLAHTEAYVQSNLVGFARVVEACRAHDVSHLVYASSSNVYGPGTPRPFAEAAPASPPVSLYGATKRANELLAHSYSALYGLPTTGLRLFTLYGPQGRPDMAVYRFTRQLLAGEPLALHGHGLLLRDLCFIDDAAQAIVRALDRPPLGDGERARLLNVGTGHAVPLRTVVALLEQALGRTAKTEAVPAEPGEVPATQAHVGQLQAVLGFVPATPVEEGIPAFVRWYREHHSPG